MSNEKRKCMVICLLALFIGLIGIVLPEIVFTPKIYINASNITVVGAGATSGSLQNISDINQGYFNITEGNAQPFYAIVNFTNVTNFSFLEVKAKYFSVSGTPSSHVVDLEIYCTTDGEYEDLFFLENADDWRYFTRHFPDAMHFIDAQGNVSIKFDHSANGNTNHRLWIDTVRLITASQFEQSTIYLNQTINNTYINQTDIAFETIVNNTNLAPTQVGVPGTGERVSGTDYYANTSEIQILLWSFTDNTGDFGDIFLFINDTMVASVDHNENPVGGKLNSSIIAHIPKYSKYKAVFLSMERYEWREYPVLSGRNGTLSINQTIVQGGGNQNLSQVLAQGNSSNQSINMMGYGLINSSTNITTLGGTYYVGKNGTDTTDCGGNTSPCLTINYMVAKLNAKPVLLENVTVHIYPGIYNENINVGGIYPGNYKLILEGEYKILNTLFVSSNNSGSTTSQAFFNSSISMTANVYKNKIMYVVNGSNAGNYRIIDNNSADNLTYVGLLTNPLATGTQINILEWNTTIKPNNPVSIKLEAMSGVYINDIALDGGISAKFSSYFINRANLTTYFTPTNPFLTTYSGQISSVYEVDTTIIQHDGTPNYVLWYTQFSSTLFKKSKIDHGSDFIGTIVQQGYFLSQEGSVYNGSYISIYVDNNGNFQADSTNGANPQYSFVKQNFGFGVNIVDGTCTNCLAGDPFPGIVYISNAVDFQTKYSGIGTDFACFNTNGTLIRQNLAC